MSAREWTREDAARLAGTFTDRQGRRRPPHVVTPGGIFELGRVPLAIGRPCWRCGADKVRQDAFGEDFCHGCGCRP